MGECEYFLRMDIEPKHYDAFNYYFSRKQEGDSNAEAMRQTAKEFNVSFRTIENWYYNMNWKQKSAQRTEQIQKEVERMENNTFAKNKKKYLDIYHRILYEFVEDGLPAKIESIRDLETVIKNSLLLQDAPTEVTKTETEHSGKVEVATPLFDRAKMEKILEQEKQSRNEDLR